MPGPSDTLDQRQLIRHITASLASEARLRALFLGGSFGRGSADACSDIDLIMLVDPKDFETLIARWPGIIEYVAGPLSSGAAYRGKPWW